ncbi:OmpA family protein [Photobacterium leiognathi]|uniref:OmpA family protein n=1 Tax=Photobacterium leiognathi TaxID=553611 RepID=UPI002980DD9D|nr:OmpA family protein [Photobacterium leiognathi]
MKTTKLKLALVAAAVISSTSAFATETTSEQSLNTHTTGAGFWVGADLGQTLIDNSDLRASNINSHGATGSVSAGYDFNKNVGLFASYDYVDALGTKENIDFGTVGAKINFHLTEKVDLSTSVGAVLIEGGDHTGMVGFGLAYNITPSIQTGIGYNYYQDLHLDAENSTDAHKIYWGMSYKFGQPDVQPIVKTVTTVREIPVVDETAVLTRNQYTMTFASGKAVIDEIGAIYLTELVNNMNKYPDLKVLVSARTDSTGSDKINELVSRKRAQSVETYLIMAGIDSSRITTESLANTKPLSTHSGRSSALERSVVISLSK